MPDFPDWGGTAVVAGDITLINQQNGGINNGQSVTFNASVIRSGYNVRLELWNATDNTTLMPVAVQVSWVDSATNFVTDVQVWYVYAGTAATTHIIRGRGPTSGDVVSITLFNNASSAATLVFNLFFTQSTRTFTLHDWRTDSLHGTVWPGITNPVLSDCFSNIVASVNAQSIGASSNIIFTLPLCSGTAYMSLSTTGPNATLTATILDAADNNIQIGAILGIGANQSTQTPMSSIALPRSQVQVRLANTDVAARLCSMSMITATM